MKNITRVYLLLNMEEKTVCTRIYPSIKEACMTLDIYKSVLSFNNVKFLVSVKYKIIVVSDNQWYNVIQLRTRFLSMFIVTVTCLCQVY